MNRLLILKEVTTPLFATTRIIQNNDSNIKFYFYNIVGLLRLQSATVVRRIQEQTSQNQDSGKIEANFSFVLNFLHAKSRPKTSFHTRKFITWFKKISHLMEKLALTEFGICLPIIQLISAFSAFAGTGGTLLEAIELVRSTA